MINIYPNYLGFMLRAFANFSRLLERLAPEHSVKKIKFRCNLEVSDYCLLEVGKDVLYLIDGENGYLVEPEKPAELTTKLTLAVEMLESSKKLRLAGLKLAEDNFNPKMHAAEVIRFLKARRN